MRCMHADAGASCFTNTDCTLTDRGVLGVHRNLAQSINTHEAQDRNRSVYISRRCTCLLLARGHALRTIVRNRVLVDDMPCSCFTPWSLIHLSSAPF